MIPQLFIMVKEPRPGRVKSRLGKDIGMVNSAWWFRHQCRQLIKRVADDKRWQTRLAVSPDAEGFASRVWPASVERWPQGNGNLGDRMKRIFRTAPKGPVVIIGADIPQIDPQNISRAFRSLGDHDAVFGPAYDGGYWLVGLKRTRAVSPMLFEKVRWSTEYALADSVKTLIDHDIAYTDTLRDVDSKHDLAQ